MALLLLGVSDVTGFSFGNGGDFGDVDEGDLIKYREQFEDRRGNKDDGQLNKPIIVQSCQSSSILTVSETCKNSASTKTFRER